MGAVVAVVLGVLAAGGAMTGTIMATQGLTKDKAEKSPPVKFHERRSQSSSNGLTITVVDGIDGWVGPGGSDGGGGGIPKVAMYPRPSGTSPDALQGDMIVLDTPHGGHTFPESDIPNRIYVTNADTTPICVAGVYATYPDNTTLVISGNLGRVCGADNYESQIEVLPMPDGSPAACVWVDRNHSNGIRLAGLTFQLQSLGGEKGSQKTVSSVEDLCKSPSMVRMTEEDSIEQVNVAAVSQAPLNFKSQLVKSGLNSSSAAKLCSEKHTIGPDFVSLSEKLYCDMDTRQLHPLCEQGVEKLCFDVDQDELVERWEGSELSGQAERRRRARGSTIGVRDAEVKVVKSFKHVAVWN
jgi:hypothetical protein